jgi:hypothetical protein
MVYTLSNEQPGCVEKLSYDLQMCGFNGREGYDDCVPMNGCGNRIAAYIFSYSFLIIVNYILLSVLIALIMKYFTISSKSQWKQAIIDRFLILWSSKVGDDGYMIPLSDFIDLFRDRELWKLLDYKKPENLDEGSFENGVKDETTDNEWEEWVHSSLILALGNCLLGGRCHFPSHFPTSAWTLTFFSFFL